MTPAKSPENFDSLFVQVNHPAGCVQVPEDLMVTGTHTAADSIHVTVNGSTMEATLYPNGDWDAGPFSVTAGTSSQCSSNAIEAQNDLIVVATKYATETEPEQQVTRTSRFWAHR